MSTAPSSTPAGEETLWTGTSSQVKNFWWFVACLLVIPIPWAIWRYLVVKCHVYRLTSERLLITHGVFNKVTDTLELYRIRDIRMTQPLWPRLFGLKNVELLTTDTTTPEIVIDYVPASLGLTDLLRKHVEQCRMRKRVREVGIDMGPDGGDAMPLG